MAEHTKEPWLIHAQKRAIVPMADIYKPIPLAGEECVPGQPAHAIALFRNPDDTMSEDETHANAIRVIECVNALAGIENPAAFVKAFEGMVEAFEGMVEALDGARDALEACGFDRSDYPMPKIISQIKAARTAREGGAA